MNVVEVIGENNGLIPHCYEPTAKFVHLITRTQQWGMISALFFSYCMLASEFFCEVYRARRSRHSNVNMHSEKSNQELDISLRLSVMFSCYASFIHTHVCFLPIDKFAHLESLLNTIAEE